MRRVPSAGLALTAVLVLGLVAGCNESPTEVPTSRTVAAPAHIPIALATASTASGATLTTDKDDYAPGDRLQLTGAGWQAGDVVDLHLDLDPLNHPPVDWAVDVDADGGFHDLSYVVQDSDAGVTFYLTATSRATGESATATFTDAALSSATVALRTATCINSLSTPVPLGTNVCAFLGLTYSSSSGAINFWVLWTSPTNVLTEHARGPLNPAPATDSDNLTVNELGMWTVQVCAADPNPTCPAPQVKGTITFEVVVADNQPPAIQNFVIEPNPVAVSSQYHVKWRMNDTQFGNSNITSAEYQVNSGIWTSAGNPTTPPFDNPIEDFDVTLTAPGAPDILQLCVRGTDAANNTNGLTGTNPIQCLYLPVYDPTAGFVTGGGWIMSLAGACPVFCNDATGSANFGFVSRYKKGANTPDGNTEFQFQAGDLNFHSTSYDWLVVTPTKATYKGYGSVNGQAGYGFLLSAIDGTPDRFRIKIWEVGADVIYDNQVGAGDNADPSTALAGGSIVIHIPKK